MKAKSFTLCLLIHFWCVQAGSQTLTMPSDTRSSGMGNPVTVLSGFSTCQSNPAGIAAFGSTSLSLSWTNYYGVIELGSGGVAFGIPTRSGNFAIGFTTSGFNALSENQATLCYARQIGSQLRAGAGIHWMVLNQPSDYRDLFAWVTSLGIQWLPGEKFIAGITVMNPAKQEYIPAGFKHIPFVIAAGIGFKPSEEFLILFEAAKNGGENIKYTVGVEATAGKCLVLRFGINRQYFTACSLGAGYICRKLSIDVAVNRHSVLGLSSSAGLSFKFQEE